MKSVLAGIACVSWMALTASTANADWMTGEQLRVLISGNTTYGRHVNKDSYGYSYNRPDGTFVGWNNQRGATSGTWEIRGNLFCRQRDGDEMLCLEVRDNGDGSYARYKQPRNLVKPKVHIRDWTKVVAGNPENL